ncbi:MAG: filamentous hemagglutinin N-terminal domain-containing protein, partial [Methylobacterium sp.]|nr:filamentous hemagglutinin N-terminal domain-containing protein [Methylobacterium sp.]
MNKQIYRLVFSRHLGMPVPVSEGVRSQAKQSGSNRLRRLLAGFLLLLAVPAGADQPAGLVPHATRAWSNATIDAARTNPNQMTIRQNAAKAILNWQTLNLDRGQILNFDQQGNRNWSALNRIFDADPSRIMGTVNAPGHIYFVNQNGIIFGDGAQINVGSLTATSLDDRLNDDILNRFSAGLLSYPSTAAFSGLSGFVRVESGATITAATGGRVMLLAPSVENAGLINTPEGQTILAAGQKVYLLDTTDPAGLLVEVDSGGTATNLGQIISERGNTTLVGLAVNQQGRISATTSVRANGSIHLLARDSVRVDQANGEVVALTPRRYGKVNIGEGSSTLVTAEVG